MSELERDKLQPRAAKPRYPTELRTALGQFAHEHITQVLNQHGGNITHTARVLGISRRALQLRLRKGSGRFTQNVQTESFKSARLIGDENGGKFTI